ncbi:MAG: LysR family transcriptional regulator [Rhizobiales bacterium]|nr:LysR family transcriptional regulator [Hyphomicrobiales bacterium]
MAKLPPLNALRCFESAARHRSFSRAATDLHVTQSAVSHQVRQLEDWFGVLLFERQGRQTVPTAKGEMLANGLAEAFAIMQESCRQVKASQAGATLTIAVLPSIATIWLIPKLNVFFRDHPEVPVKVVYLLAGQPLNFNDIDIAITWGKEGGAGEGRASRFLAGDSVAVANPALIAREGPFDKSHQLLHAPLLHDTDRQGWQRFMRKLGFRHANPESGPVFEDFNLLRAAALAGQGLALCPRSLIHDDVLSGRLVVLFEGTAINEDWGYWLVEPLNTEGRADAIAAFKSWLMKEAAA